MNPAEKFGTLPPEKIWGLFCFVKNCKRPNFSPISSTTGSKLEPGAGKQGSLPETTFARRNIFLRSVFTSDKDRLLRRSHLFHAGRTAARTRKLKMMSWIRVKLPVTFLIVGLAAYVVFLEVEASDESDEQISASAVWNPQAPDLERIRQTCQTEQGDAYSRCFIEQMSAFGASPEAVAFTQAYALQNQGMVAFLNDFRAVDPVDVGYAVFPSGADFSQRWLLLNGTPPVINVDDFSLLPQAEMMRDSVYAALLRRYPKVTLFDGNRSSDTAPQSETLPDAGQRFVIEYPLKDQCRACPVVGQASFSFEFDATGRLVKVRFVKVSAVSAPAR